jgi:hypothetical protein
MGFDPIPDLATTNAETTIWILQNGVSYTGPVYDPWYKSTTRTSLGNSTVWQSDETASALGTYILSSLLMTACLTVARVYGKIPNV